jgi:hypothetical protein
MYSYEKYNFRIVTLLLVLMTIIFLAHEEYIGGIISAVLGILLTFSFQGVRIDGPGRRFLRYDRFLKLRIGRWEKLPPPSYVTIVRINLSSQRRQAGPMVMPEGKKGAKAFKVNLVVDGDIRYVPICRGPLDRMTEEALKLGEALDLRVLDYTTHEKHWIR